MICKNCGQEIDDASKFCEHCGSRLVKKKGKKAKKIILGIISIILIVAIAFSLRFLLFKTAFDRIDDMLVNNSSNIDSLILYDDFIKANITDNYLKPSIFRFTDHIFNLDVYTDGDNHITYSAIADINNFGVAFYNNKEAISYWDDADGMFYNDYDFNFEDGRTYKVHLRIGVWPLGFLKNDMLKEIDYFVHRFINYAIHQNSADSRPYYTNSIIIESYFKYENGEFIKASQ